MTPRTDSTEPKRGGLIPAQGNALGSGPGKPASPVGAPHRGATKVYLRGKRFLLSLPPRQFAILVSIIRAEEKLSNSWFNIFRGAEPAALAARDDLRAAIADFCKSSQLL